VSDLTAFASLAYQVDARTSVELSVNGSTIIDSRLRDWFDLLGVEKNNVWAAVSVSWGF
jgi:hypothetical protein